MRDRRRETITHGTARDELFADLTYRESHAFLGTASGGGTDVERFLTLRAVYRR